VEGYTPAQGERLQTNEEVVTEDYFSTVGLHLVEGRLFGPEDRSPGSRATVINQTMARRFFEGRGAIGKRWNYGGDLDPEAYVIVGVVEDARYTELRTAPPNMAYRLSAAASDEVLSNLEVRTRVPPSQLAATVRAAINQAVPALPVFDVVTLEQRMTRGASNERLIANLSTAFGTIALLLAAIGLYGTISYSVSRRVSELGVRMALGAARTNVLWLVMREALLLVVAGSAVGFVLALFAARSLRSLLYTVPPVDPVAFGAGVAALLGIAGAAAWLPAHRASRIDPMTALRKE
jgi:predicted permease